VEVRKIKVHGAVALRVEAAGAVLGQPDEAGWATAVLPSPVTTSEMKLSLTPTGEDARFDELELWGAGHDVGPRGADSIASLTSSGSTPAFENVWVIRASPDSASLRPVGMIDGGPCFSTSFPAYEPRQARRGFLAFEANIPRGVVLQHSLNGEAPVDGIWLGSGSARRTLVDEIDVERLRGGDALQLCLPEEAAGPVDVSGVRLVLLLDDGSNAFDRDAALRYGQAVDGAESTAVTLEAGSHVFGLDRPIDLEEVELRVGKAAAHLSGVATRLASAWTDWGTVDAAGPVARLPVSGAADAIRVELDAAKGPLSVAELRVEYNEKGKRTARMVQWHPGGGHHGSEPYWKVSGPEAGTTRVGPQFQAAPK
jgi:hypothetical protein